MDLEKAFYAIQEQEREAERAYNQEYERMKQDAIRKLNLFMATLHITKNWDELRQARVKAFQLMTDEKERKAVAGTNAPFPLGTKLKFVKRTGRYSETTKFGVVEAVTRETVLPETITNARYSYLKPNIGDFIVRLLKADGTLSKNIDKIHGGWLPLDETIERKKAAPLVL